MKTVATFFLVTFLLFPFPEKGGAAQPDLFLSAFNRQLRCFPLQLVNLERQTLSITDEELCLATIYSATGMRPLWVTAEGPGEKAAVILEFLENARAEGMEPEEYGVGELRRLWSSNDPDDLARLETTLTLGLITYVHDVTHGRIAPYRTDPKLFAEAGEPRFRPVSIVQQALETADLRAYLAGLPPRHQHYTALRRALRLYRERAAQGKSSPIPGGALIFPGDRDARLPLVRARLSLEKQAEPAADPGSAYYDEATVAAVRAFQRKFGLEPDGIIGPKTLAVLNTGPVELARKITLNMARWRWQEHDLGRRYVLVNIANYDLRLFEENREIIEMPVIVGKLRHQTPVFSDRIRYLDFNPFWTIPPSIARNEELPRLREDPFYLVNRHVRLFAGWQGDDEELDSTLIDWNTVSRRDMDGFRLRQDPGPWNALGPVKFAFPNRYNVYIHGTPAPELFEHHTRNFSHGCIRAGQPLLLASLLLGGGEAGWPVERIREIVDKGARKVIRLAEPVPVHITYQTAWVDKEGEIHFNNDTYNRDAKLARILFARKNGFRVPDGEKR